MSDWQLIETYPRDADGWGAEVLVRLPPQPIEGFELRGTVFEQGKTPETFYVSHLEADMWLVRCGDVFSWSQIYEQPTHWMPLPNPPPPREQGA